MFIVRNFRRGERFPDRTILAVVGLLVTLTASASAQNAIPETQDFGSIAVPSSSSPITLNYTLSGISSAPSFSLNYGAEFMAATPSCSGSGTISCSVGVQFSPAFPGLRQDALVITDQFGNFLGSTLLYGIGLAPQMALTPGMISTIAGRAGRFGYSGDGNAATSASLANPEGVAVDAAGNVYIADSINAVIRKVTAATGLISTIAGTADTPGYSGDGGPATSATLNSPTGIALDGAGNLYIADQGNNVIREVNVVTGVISTVAGGGNPTAGLGDGGPATAANLYGPNDVAVDALGNLYIADSYHGRIRKVTASNGVIITLAGGGVGGGSDGLGDGSWAITSILDNPTGVAVDASGNVYIADSGNFMVRQINTAGMINVVAGDGNPGFSGDLGPATSAELENPASVQVDAGGNIYIADCGANVIREVTAATGIINTVAGTGATNDTGDGGNAVNAGIGNPWSLSIDAAGNIYLADPSDNVIRKVTVNSSALGFAATDIGQASPAQLVTVSNIGNQSLNLSALAVSANFQQQASGYSDCSASSAIGSGSNCFVAIASVPSITGGFNGTLTITGNSLNQAGTSQAATLSGTGNNAPVAKVSINPSSVSFGNQNVGTLSAAKTVTLSNIGTASLTIAGISLSGPNSPDFGVSTNCGGSLAVNASCTVSLTFTPSAAGARSASLTFSDSVAGSPQAISITGTGTQPQAPPPPPPGVTLNPPSISFPTQNLGASSSPVTVTLTNSGGSSLSLSGISMSGSNGPDFPMTTTCGPTLAPGASCNLNVAFKPLAAGLRSASLTLTDNAPGSLQTVPLSGTGNAVFFTQVPGALSQISVGGDGTLWGLNSAGEVFEFNSSNQSWTWIPGSLSRIVVGSNNAVWGLNATQQIYARDMTKQAWKAIPGALAQLAIGCDGDVWGLNAAGSIYHFDAPSGNWQQIPGALARLAVGSDGAVWGLNAGGSIYRYSVATHTFSPVPGFLTQISVGADGDAWGLNNQSIYHFDRLTQAWVPMAGALSYLAVGSGGNVYGLNAANQICEYNPQSQTCTWIPGALAQIAVGGNGVLWGLDGSGDIWTFNQRAQAAGVFHLMPGILSQIAVAPDGSVWALSAGGSIYEFNPSTQNWINVPGLLAQISIGPNGTVWGLNSAGMVFRFDPSAQSWAWIPGTLAHITVGANGDVWGLNATGQIYQFNFSSQTWTQVPGALAQISVGADGTVWGLNSAGQIYRFNSSSRGWVSIPGSLSQISVGSSGNVWGLNWQGSIYRFDSQNGGWKQIPGSLSRIAVAFDGAVWGINSAGLVYRFNAQTNAWDLIPGSLAQIQIASDAVVWGLDAGGVPYHFQ
jgi:sugar lactone lactonase YvrE